MALSRYLVEVRLANEKPVQIEVFADTNGSMNSDNPFLKKAVEAKISQLISKKVTILNRKIIKKY
ncbi:MAG: hypothetical protein N2319_04610 [Candidatus Kapabacteria bacterium]|nr:hypothetical protein [Candidatus Kapabacteria bacterium]